MSRRNYSTNRTLKVFDTAHIKTLVVGGDPYNGTAGTTLTEASIAEMNTLDGLTATATELNYLDIATLGTGAASKAVVLDASGDYTYPASATIVYPSSATLTLQSGSTFNVAGTFQVGGVAVTATAAELNYLDIATLGTGAASKAVVLDASGDYTYPAAATIVYPSGATLTLQSGSTLDVAGTFNIGAVAMTSTAAELNLLDGASAANATASKALVLDSTKRTVTTATAGTPGTGVTAVEFSADGINFTSILTLTGVAATIGDTAALAGGALIYTFPAGAMVVNSASMSVAMQLTTGTPTSDTPELGLGTVIGSGAVATLGDVGSTSEDILGPKVAADINGTANLQTNANNLVIEAAAAHTVHLNYADTWANVDDTAATIAGTVVLRWTKLPLA